MISLADVERALAVRGGALEFDAALEQQFAHDTRHRREKRLQSSTFATAGVYNLFILVEMMLAPDQFWLALAFHLLIVTPWLLTAAWIFSRQPRPLLREIVAASLPLVMAVEVIAVFMRSQSPEISHFHYYIILLPSYACVLQQLPFRFARGVCIALIVIYGAALCLTHSMPWEVSLSAFDMLLGCSYVSMISNYYIDRDARRSYLDSLRDRMRKTQADAALRSDVLTELGNRLLLTETVAEWWGAGDAHDVSPVAAVMIDVDCFKAYNDRFGHPAGDRCLRRVAGCVVDQLTGPDALAIRYGGEEFLVLLKRTELAAAVTLAEQMRRAVEAMGIPHDGFGVRNIVTASFGVAAAPVRALSAAELIAAADSALYAAKRGGRNQVWPPFVRARTERVTPAPVLLLPGRRSGRG